MLLTKNKVTSAVASFAVVASLAAFAPAPALAATVAGPPNASVVQTDGVNRYTWDAVSGAISYRVQFSRTSDFSVILETGDTTARTYVPKQNFDTSSGSSLYWRVAAFTENGGQPTTDWTVPAPVALTAAPGPGSLSPAANQTFSYPAPVKFSWATVPSAQFYELQYVVGGDFGSAGVVNQTSVSNSFSPTTELVNGTWTWRVRAKVLSPQGENNYTNWTTPQDFKVEWKDADSAVTLNAPVPTSTDTEAISDPVFTWQPVVGASYYKITVARDFAMTNTLIPATPVYGTTYVPTGSLLNGEYYWTVTAYDAAGNPGYIPTTPQRFIRRWGTQTEPNQPAANGPNGIEAKPVPAANMGSTNYQTATFMDWNKFELKWAPIARATRYRVTVKTASTAQNPGVYTCDTPNTSVTMVSSYNQGAQSPGLFRGAGSCLGYLPRYENIDGNAVTLTYQWRVQAIDDSGSNEKYGQGELVSAESDPLYFKFTCDGGNVCGGGDTASLTLDPNGTWATQGGDNDLTTAPAPLMEWSPVAGNCEPNNTVNPQPMGYEVRVYRGTGVSVHVATFYTFSTRLRANGIFKDDNTAQSYYWRVRPMCGGLYYGNDWDLLPAKDWTRTTNPTTVPTVYQESANGALLLKWTPQLVTGPRDGGTAGYQVNYRIAGTTNWSSINVEYPFWVPNQNNSPLGSGTYEFRVAPLDANYDVGRWSATNTFTIAPTAPAGLSATSGTSYLNLAWNPSQIADGYEVRYQRVGDSNWTTAGFTQQTSYTIPGLAPASYNVSIRARSAGYNFSSWASSVTGVVPTKTITPVTTDNSVVNVAARYLQWTAVADASRYQVKLAPSQNELSNANPFEVNDNVYTPTDDVRYGRIYYWQVFALNENGVVIGSSSPRGVYFTTTPFEPGITTVTKQDTNMVVNWSALSNEASGDGTTLTYRVRYMKLNQVPAAAWQYGDFTSGAATSATVTNLDSNADYAFQVQAKNTQGEGRWSGTYVAGTARVPDAPVNFFAETIRDTNVTYVWNAPFDGGSAVTGYTLKYKKVSDTEWVSKNLAKDVTRYEIKGLVKNTNYNVELVAKNAVGVSPAATSTIKTIALPSAPRSFKVKVGNGNATLVWSPPAEAGTSSIIEYVIEGRIKENGSWTDWAFAASAPATSKEQYFNVANGLMIQYRIAARTAEGLSPYATAPAFVAGIEKAPKVKLTNVKKLVKVSWNKVSDTATGYKFQWSLDGKKWKTLKSVGGPTSKAFTTKVGKKKKYLYVRGATKNTYGWSAYGPAAKIKKK